MSAGVESAGGPAREDRAGTLPAGGGPAAAGAAASWSAIRAEVWRWHLPLLAGVLPALVLGFLASAAANRVAFAAWGALAALAWFAALRISLVRGWSRARRAGALLLVAAASLASLAPLLARDGAALGSGLRALAPLPGAAPCPPEAAE